MRRPPRTRIAAALAACACLAALAVACGPAAPAEAVARSTGARAAGRAYDGAPPAEDEIKNYFLFLPKPVLRGPGTVLTLTLRGLAVCKIEFDPAADAGVKPL